MCLTVENAYLLRHKGPVPGSNHMIVRRGLCKCSSLQRKKVFKGPETTLAIDGGGHLQILQQHLVPFSDLQCLQLYRSRHVKVTIKDRRYGTLQLVGEDSCSPQ